MGPEIRRAHAETLREWSDQYDRAMMEGDSEIVFLMRRTARALLKEPEPAHGLANPVMPEPREA